jgi:hypothetical protein
MQLAGVHSGGGLNAKQFMNVRDLQYARGCTRCIDERHEPGAHPFASPQQHAHSERTDVAAPRQIDGDVIAGGYGALQHAVQLRDDAAIEIAYDVNNVAARGAFTYNGTGLRYHGGILSMPGATYKMAFEL